VTSVTPAATSFLSVRATLSIAAIADAPQIENPVATSRPSPLDTPTSRASASVPAKLTKTVTTTASTVPQPKRVTSCTLNCKPSSTTPMRRNLRVTHCKPVSVVLGNLLPISTPMRTATVNALSTGITPLTASAPAAPAIATAMPGAFVR
jgi:hypothetical protein